MVLRGDVTPGSITASATAFTFNGTTITRTGGSFVTDGFSAGMSIHIAGGTLYDGDYLIASLTDDRADPHHLDRRHERREDGRHADRPVPDPDLRPHRHRHHPARRHDRRRGRHDARLSGLHPSRRQDAHLRQRDADGGRARRRGPLHGLLPAVDERGRRPHADARRPGPADTTRSTRPAAAGAAQLHHQRARHRCPGPRRRHADRLRRRTARSTATPRRARRTRPTTSSCSAASR